MVTRYHTLTEARNHLPEIVDEAEDGLPVSFERRGVGFVVASKDLYVRALGRNLPPPEVYAEDDLWTIVLPETPIAAEAGVFEEAIMDFIAALREYAEDWIEHPFIRNAPNHRDNAPLVHLIRLLGDDELRAWVLREGTPRDVAPGALI